jgi:hypothetical protein
MRVPPYPRPLPRWKNIPRERGQAIWGGEHEDEAAVGEAEVVKRRGQKRTLTNLYNARPTWLDLAHKKLDAAVCDAYGWPHDLTDEQILEKLLALNLQRAAQALP